LRKTKYFEISAKFTCTSLYVCYFA